MISFFTLAAVLAATPPLPASGIVSEEVAALGMLPSQRQGIRINPQERNPFASETRETTKSPETPENESQESKIRALFRQLHVSGIRHRHHGQSLALVNDLILREGEEIDPVLPDQTERLVVSKIESNQIELNFIETKESTQPRSIILPVRHQVQVTQKLPAQPAGSTGSFYIARQKPPLETATAAAATMAANTSTAPALTAPTTDWIEPAHTSGTDPGATDAADTADTADTSADTADNAKSAIRQREAAALAGWSDTSALIQPQPTTAATKPDASPAARRPTDQRPASPPSISQQESVRPRP
jgi:hypothetical protein